MSGTEKTLGPSGIGIKPERLRALRPDDIPALAASMKQLGQLQPIIVRPVGKSDSDGNGYWLIAGRHRLEAAKLLKWPAIRATVLDGITADMAELIEIDENLIRSELTPAERVMHVGRRKELYEKLHPETKHGGDRKSKSSRQVGELKRFTQATAKATKQSERKVQRDATRAKEVVVLGEIVGTSLDKGAEIDALAKLPEAEQRKLAAAAKAGENVSARHHVTEDAEASAAKRKETGTARERVLKAALKRTTIHIDLQDDDPDEIAATLVARLGKKRLAVLARAFLRACGYARGSDGADDSAAESEEPATAAIKYPKRGAPPEKPRYAGNGADSAADTAEQRKQYNATLAPTEMEGVPDFIARKPKASA
jgi:ParB family transcriptional regulator, chromosome partitioning protein